MKTIFKITAFILGFGMLNSCAVFYTQDYVENGTSKKINGTDKFVSADYGIKLVQKPSNTNPVVKVKITKDEKYQYSTRSTNTVHWKKNNMTKLLTAAGGLGLVGGAIAKSTDRSGGGFLTLVSAGAFGFTTLLPNTKKTQRQENNGTKTYSNPGSTGSGLAIVVDYNGTKKTATTNSSGIISFDVVKDFGLKNFDSETNVRFKFYKGNTLLKENGYNTYIALKSSQWTNHNIRIVAQDAKITNANGYTLKTPLLGMTYQVKEYNYYKNAYKIDLPNNQVGYIKTKDVESFYTFGAPEQMSIKEGVKQYVEVRLKQWAVQGEFEPTAAFAERMRNKDTKVKELTNEALWKFEQEYKNSIDWRKAYVNGKYDPDNEVFKVTIPDLGDILVQIPLDDAQYFKENFNQYKLMNPDFQLVDGKWELQKLDFSNYVADSYVYTQKAVKYDPIKEFNINTNFTVDINDNKTNNNNSNSDFDVKDDYDIEFGYPTNSKVNEKAWAIVIGNTNYEHTGKVDFAINDAKLMADYLKNVMGFKQVKVLTDAGKIDMVELFGNEDDDGQLHKLIRDTESELFVFYSGHGAPGTEDKDKGRGYLVPVDAKPNKLRLMGYSLELFYKQIAKIPAKKRTIVLDACFSGEGVIKNVSALGIKPKDEQVDLRNTVVMTSSTGEQFSNWYNEKRHGMFTFYFLKAIHYKENSDVNRDNKLTYQEIFNYLSNVNTGIPYWSNVIHNREQTPTIKGDIKDQVLVDFTDF